MQSRLVGLTAAVAAATVLALAACGSSGGSSSQATGAPTAGASSPTSTPTGSPIVIGTLGNYTGTFASSKGAIPDVMDAWVADVNAHGGINGHPVKLIVKDLGDNSAAGLSAAKELVEQDKVAAIVAESDNSDGVWANYIASTGVPVIGGMGVNLPFATNPDFFPSAANIFAIVYGIEVLAKANGTKGAILYCAEAPQCASSVPLYNGMSPVTGETFPVSAKVASDAPSYTPVCEAVKSSGAETIVPNVGSALIPLIAEQCKAVGVNAKIVAGDGAVVPSFSQDSSLNGMLFDTSVAPWFARSTPASKAFLDVVKQYEPGTNDELLGTDAMMTWVGAQLFEAAAEAVPAGTPVTAASLKTALYSLKGDTLGGLTAPLTFVKNKPTLVNCFFTASLENGTFTTPNGLKTTCAPDALISAIVSKLPPS